MPTTNRAVERQPRRWDEIKSQPYPVERLRRSLETGVIAPAHLLAGPSGSGKTSSAVLFGASLVCQNPDGIDPCWQCEMCRSVVSRTCPDFKFVDGTADRSLAFVKGELIPFMEAQPWYARHRVLVIDEAHNYKTDAIQAFLTVLETLPQRGPKTTVFFCTTELKKIPVTIRNRCLTLNFTRLNDADLAELVFQEYPELTDEAFEALIEESDGSMRTLYATLDALEGSVVTEDRIRQQTGTLTTKEREQLWSALSAGQYGKALGLWDRFNERKLELDSVSEQLLKDATLRMAAHPEWSGWPNALDALGFASVYNRKAHWAAALFTLVGCPSL